MDARTLYGLGIALIFAGTLIILIAVILLFLSCIREGKVKGGGVIIIGPFPIIFGTDKKSIKTILILSILLTTLLIIVMVMFHLMIK